MITILQKWFPNGREYRSDGNMGDQSRVMTPAKARETGTEFIVVGRPITQAEDVVAAYRRVYKDFIG